MNTVEIYLCEYFEQEQYIPRHYVSSIAKCILLSTRDLKEIENKLSSEHLEQLINTKELVLVDRNTIEKIINKTSSSNQFIYLILKLKNY